MRGLLQHGREAEEFAVHRLLHQHLLLVFVDGGDVDCAGEENVGSVAGLAEFVDALARGEIAQFDLRGEYAELVVVEQREEGNVAEFSCVAGHKGLKAERSSAISKSTEQRPSERAQCRHTPRPSQRILPRRSWD